MKQVLITGVAGFIGSHIAQRFISEGLKVYGVDDLSNGKISNISKEIDFIQLDLADPEEIKKIPSGIKYILHLAGQSSGEISYHKPILDLKKNTLSTLNLINYGINNNSKKIIYASSMSVYGDPLSKNPVSENSELFAKSCYGISKLSSEKYLEIYKEKLPFISMRMFNVYGPGQDLTNLKQGMVSIYLAQAIKEKKIIVKGSLLRFRDFIYIDDVTEAWFNAFKLDNVFNEKINIGTGVKTTVYDLLKKILKITKTTDYIVKEETPCDQLGLYANNTKLKDILKIKKLTSLDEGLYSFYNWASNLNL